MYTPFMVNGAVEVVLVGAAVPNWPSTIWPLINDKQPRKNNFILFLFKSSVFFIICRFFIIATKALPWLIIADKHNRFRAHIACLIKR